MVLEFDEQKKSSLLFSYLVTLNVIQPARVQDVYEFASQYVPDSGLGSIPYEDFKYIHGLARDRSLVVAVKKGVYTVSRKAFALTHNRRIGWQVDNRRLFLMKKQRRDLMR